MDISFPVRPMLSVVVALLTVSCGPTGLQRQDQFAWAMESAGSTSPPIVRVRLVDAQNRSGVVRCMFGRTLVDGIMQEKNLPMTDAGYRQAVSYALASRDHSFRFVRPTALKVINESQGMMNAGLLKGCELIKQGKSALWADMQATVIEGPHFPMPTGPR